VVAPKLSDALQRAVAAQNGELPANPDKIKAFLDPAVDASLLSRYTLNPSSGNKPFDVIYGGQKLSLVETNAVDPCFDTVFSFSAYSDAMTIVPTYPLLVDSIKAAIQDYVAHNGVYPQHYSQLGGTSSNTITARQSEEVFAAITAKADVGD
jgi:hypothetical protein